MLTTDDLVLRSGKGSTLTVEEMDQNFTVLSTDQFSEGIRSWSGFASCEGQTINITVPDPENHFFKEVSPYTLSYDYETGILSLLPDENGDCSFIVTSAGRRASLVTFNVYLYTINVRGAKRASSYDSGVVETFVNPEWKYTIEKGAIKSVVWTFSDPVVLLKLSFTAKTFTAWDSGTSTKDKIVLVHPVIFPSSFTVVDQNDLPCAYTTVRMDGYFILPTFTGQPWFLPDSPNCVTTYSFEYLTSQGHGYNNGRSIYFDVSTLTQYNGDNATYALFPEGTTGTLASDTTYFANANNYNISLWTIQFSIIANDNIALGDGLFVFGIKHETQAKYAPHMEQDGFNLIIYPSLNGSAYGAGVTVPLTDAQQHLITINFNVANGHQTIAVYRDMDLIGSSESTDANSTINTFDWRTYIGVSSGTVSGLAIGLWKFWWNCNLTLFDIFAIMDVFEDSYFTTELDISGLGLTQKPKSLVYDNPPVVYDGETEIFPQSKGSDAYGKNMLTFSRTCANSIDGIVTVDYETSQPEDVDLYISTYSDIT